MNDLTEDLFDHDECCHDKKNALEEVGNNFRECKSRFNREN